MTTQQLVKAIKELREAGAEMAAYLYGASFDANRSEEWRARAAAKVRKWDATERRHSKHD